MIKNYIKLALKVLARRKFFTFISLFGISITLLVLMVATALLDNVFAPRQPESRFDRVLGVYRLKQTGPESQMRGLPGYKFLDRYLRGLKGAEATSIFSTASGVTMFVDGRRIETHLKRTDGAYWQILDFHFIEGGPFSQVDDANGNFVAVISNSMRAKIFAGLPAVGKTIEANGQRFRVVGVVEDVPILRYAGFSEIWVPHGTAKSSDYRHNLSGQFAGIVLARNKADMPAMRAEFAQRVSRAVPDDVKQFKTLTSALETQFEAASTMSLGMEEKSAPLILFSILALAALLFATLPTLNLVSINLSRILERSSEIGVRKAFGASSRALVGQFVTENVVLTVIGGLLGFVLSVVVIAILNTSGMFPNFELDLNVRIFAYAMVLAFLFGILSGVYPAWRMSRLHPVNALRGGAL